MHLVVYIKIMHMFSGLFGNLFLETPCRLNYVNIHINRLEKRHENY